MTTIIIKRVDISSSKGETMRSVMRFRRTNTRSPTPTINTYVHQLAIVKAKPPAAHEDMIK